MRRAAKLAALATIFLSTALAPANAGTLSVPMDQVKVISFTKPVSTVFMGNPVIADVTLIDSRHAFLMGKTYGQTNLIALAADGSTISNDQVAVSGRTVGLVTLNRGAEQFNYACTRIHCETQPVPGDPQAYFDTTHDAQTKHEDMGMKAATVGAVASNASPQ